MYQNNDFFTFLYLPLNNDYIGQNSYRVSENNYWRLTFCFQLQLHKFYTMCVGNEVQNKV